MRLNKPKAIQGLTNIKRLKSIPSLSPREGWQKGAIIGSVKILLLISYVNYDAMMIIEDGKEWTGEKALLIDTYLLIVKKLFGKLDGGYMMKKEFLQIKRDFKIRFDK